MSDSFLLIIFLVTIDVFHHSPSVQVSFNSFNVISNSSVNTNPY